MKRTWIGGVALVLLVVGSSIVSLPIAAHATVITTVPASIVEVCATPAAVGMDMTAVAGAVPQYAGCPFGVMTSCGSCLACLLANAGFGGIGGWLCIGMCISCGGVLQDCYPL